MPKRWRSPKHPEKCWYFSGPLHWLWGSFKIYGLGSRKKNEIQDFTNLCALLHIV